MLIWLVIFYLAKSSAYLHHRFPTAPQDRHGLTRESLSTRPPSRMGFKRDDDLEPSERSSTRPRLGSKLWQAIRSIGKAVGALLRRDRGQVMVVDPEEDWPFETDTVLIHEDHQRQMKLLREVFQYLYRSHHRRPGALAIHESGRFGVDVSETWNERRSDPLPPRTVTKKSPVRPVQIPFPSEISIEPEAIASPKLEDKGIPSHNGVLSVEEARDRVRRMLSDMGRGDRAVLEQTKTLAGVKTSPARINSYTSRVSREEGVDQATNATAKAIMRSLDETADAINAAIERLGVRLPNSSSIPSTALNNASTASVLMDTQISKGISNYGISTEGNLMEVTAEDDGESSPSVLDSSSPEVSAIDTSADKNGEGSPAAMDTSYWQESESQQLSEGIPEISEVTPQLNYSSGTLDFESSEQPHEQGVEAFIGFFERLFGFKRSSKRVNGAQTLTKTDEVNNETSETIELRDYAEVLKSNATGTAGEQIAEEETTPVIDDANDPITEGLIGSNNKQPEQSNLFLIPTARTNTSKIENNFEKEEFSDTSEIFSSGGLQSTELETVQEVFRKIFGFKKKSRGNETPETEIEDSRHSQQMLNIAEERKLADEAAARAEALRVEEESLARAEEERKAAEEAAARAEALRVEEESLARAEEESLARAEEESLARAEGERKAAEEAAARAEALRVEEESLARAEEERKAAEEAATLLEILNLSNEYSGYELVDLGSVSPASELAIDQAAYGVFLFPEVSMLEFGRVDMNAVLSRGNSVLVPDITGPFDKNAVGAIPGTDVSMISSALGIPSLLERASDAVTSNFAFLSSDLEEGPEAKLDSWVDVLNEFIVGKPAASFDEYRMNEMADPFAISVKLDFLGRSYEPITDSFDSIKSQTLEIGQSKSSSKYNNVLWRFGHLGNKLRKDFLIRLRNIVGKSKTLDIDVIELTDEEEISTVMSEDDATHSDKFQINEVAAQSEEFQGSLIQSPASSRIIDAEVITRENDSIPLTGGIASTIGAGLNDGLSPIIGSASENDLVFDALNKNREKFSSINSTVEELSRIDQDVLQILIEKLSNEPSSPANKFAIRALKSLERNFNKFEEKLQSIHREFAEIEREWGVENENDLSNGFPEYIQLIYELLDDSFPVS